MYIYIYIVYNVVYTYTTNIVAYIQYKYENIEYIILITNYLNGTYFTYTTTTIITTTYNHPYYAPTFPHTNPTTHPIVTPLLS